MRRLRSFCRRAASVEEVSPVRRGRRARKCAVEWVRPCLRAAASQIGQASLLDRIGGIELSVENAVGVEQARVLLPIGVPGLQLAVLPTSERPGARLVEPVYSAEIDLVI